MTSHEALRAALKLLPELKRLDADIKAKWAHWTSLYGEKFSDKGNEIAQRDFFEAASNFASTKNRETIIAALEAAERIAKPAMLSGGDGMVMVPRKATKEMLQAAYNRDHDGTTSLYFKIWEAMIAAAPAPASNGEAVGRNAVLEEAAEIARAEQLRQLSKRGNNELDEAWETHNYGAVVSANIYDAIRALASAPAPQGMDVVERVARAICIARGFDPDDASGGELMWTAYDQAARAALSAINEKEDK